MAVSLLNPNYVFCTGNIYVSGQWCIAVSHSSDGGTTWEHDTIPGGSNGFAVAFDAVDPNLVYVGGDSAYSYTYPQLLVSTDLGVTWTPRHAGLNGRVWAIAADPVQSGVVYCGTYRGVFKSTNAGASWTATPLAYETRALVVDPTDPAKLYAGTYGNGVYVSTNAGATWTAMNTGLGCLRILSLGLRPGPGSVLYAGTDGGAVYRTDILTSVTDQPASEVRAARFEITPNPCRDRAFVRLLTQAHDSSITATVSLFDVTGKRVLSTKGAGFWELDVSALAPGSYFVSLAGPGQRLIARLIVTR